MIKTYSQFCYAYSNFLCQTIEESVLSELLGLVQENAVGTWIELYGWKVSSLYFLCSSKFLCQRWALTTS